MNLPNSLTVLRIFFVPVLIVVLLTRSPNVELWGFSMHFEVWGVLILLMAAAFISLVGMQDSRGHSLVAPWMVVIIIGREFTILGLRNIASAEGFTIA